MLSEKFICYKKLFASCLLLCMGIYTGVAQSCNSTCYNFNDAVSISGSGSQTFGIATDASGNVYVASEDKTIQKYGSNSLLITSWGGTIGSGNGQFNGKIYGLACDASGNVYAIDQGNNRVQKFNSSGVYISQFGSTGVNNGQFKTPSGICVDANGYIYVVDQVNNRVQKFNSSGTFISKFGSSGTGNGSFNTPVAVAVDASGYIYVTDQGNSRVQKFNSNGTYLSQFGSAGTSDGQFSKASGITVDASGNIYVSDAQNNRIQIFNSSGTFIYSWQPGISSASPIQIARDTQCKVYASDKNHGVFTSSISGPEITSFSPATGSVNSTVTITGKRFIGITQVSINGINASYTVNSSTQLTLTIPAGASTSAISITGCGVTTSTSSSFTVCNNPIFTPSSGNAGSTVVISGNCFTGATAVSFNSINATSFSVDSDNQITAIVPAGASTGIIKVSIPGGTLLSTGTFSVSSCIGSTYTFYSNTSGYNVPGQIALDNSGNIFVTCSGSCTVRKNNTSWGSCGSGNGQFASNAMYGIALDVSGNVYVADGGNNRIQKFDNSGNYLSQFGGSGSGNGLFNLPKGIAIDASGNIFVADYNNNLIQKFNSSGAFISQWAYTNPMGITVDYNGNVYVGGYGDISKFSNSGTFIQQWTGGTTAFSQIYGLATDISGNVYASDVAYNVIQKLNVTTGNFSVIIGYPGAPGLGYSALYAPSGVFITPACDLYMTNIGTSSIRKYTLTSGARTASSTSSWETSEEQKTMISAYPNPNNGEFMVIASGQKHYSIYLYNYMGELVFEGYSDSEIYTLSDPNLKEGVYVLHVIGEGEISKTKITIRK